MSDNPGHGDDVAGADDLTRISGNRIEDRRAAERGRHPDLRRTRGAFRRRHRQRCCPTSAACPRRGSTAGGTRPESSPGRERPVAGAAGNGQHYESFLVRVLLNEDGSVRRTTVRHVRTGAERHWPGWNVRRCPTSSRRRRRSAPAGGSETRRAAPTQRGRPSPAPAAAPPAEEPPVAPDAAGHARVIRGPVGRAHHAPRGRAVHDDDDHRPRRAGGPAPTGSPTAPSSWRGRWPAGRSGRVAQADGLLATASPTISIDAAGLPPGAYRLDGAVSLREPGADHPVDLAAIAEGLLVQVLPG